VAAAHAGWRGTVADMAGAAVAALCRLGARPKDIRAALLPSIGPCCFEVQADVADRFAAVVPESVQQRQGRLYADLWTANRALLLRAGLEPGHIDAATRCTLCDPATYFSYRRDGAQVGKTGQHLAFIIGGTA
jgi:YfiH family protein